MAILVAFLTFMRVCVRGQLRLVDSTVIDAANICSAITSSLAGTSIRLRVTAQRAVSLLATAVRSAQLVGLAVELGYLTGVRLATLIAFCYIACKIGESVLSALISILLLVGGNMSASHGSRFTKSIIGRLRDLVHRSDHQAIEAATVGEVALLLKCVGIIIRNSLIVVSGNVFDIGSLISNRLDFRLANDIVDFLIIEDARSF